MAKNKNDASKGINRHREGTKPPDKWIAHEVYVTMVFNPEVL